MGVVELGDGDITCCCGVALCLSGARLKLEQANTGEGPEFLSDHPDNERRIEALKEHFRANPTVFSRFSPEQSSALALVVPRKAPIVFLR